MKSILKIFIPFCILVSCTKVVSHDSMPCSVFHITDTSAVVSFSVEIPSRATGYNVGVCVSTKDPKHYDVSLDGISSSDCIVEYKCGSPGSQVYTIVVSGLEPETNYKVRSFVFAGLDGSVTWGEMESFKTLARVDHRDDPSNDPGDDPDDPDDPGDDTDDIDIANVVFSNQNGDYCFYVETGREATIELSLERRCLYYEEDAYAIKVNSASNGLVFPEFVVFGENQTNATISIIVSKDIDPYEVIVFSLSLYGENVDSSTLSDFGTISCEGTIHLYRPVTLAGCVGGDDTYFSYFGYFKQDAWIIDSKIIVLKNFLNSENDLTVRADDGHEVIAYSYSSYDLYECSDGYGGTACWFWVGESEYGEYEEFFPKGDDKREIYRLALDIYPDYSCYSFNNANQVRLVLPCYAMSVYSETEDLDVLIYWPYLYFNEYDDATMSTLDFENYPDLPESSDEGE